MNAIPPTVGRFDRERASAAVRELLLAIGEDPDREGLLDTPDRVARAFEEMTGGLRMDAGEPLRTLFGESCAGTVIVRDIELSSLCEHHLLPFYGTAHVAYQPDGGKVTGLSKLARAVDALARRPQVQERLTEDLCRTVSEELNARGVFVLVECAHMCMAARGVRQRSSVTVTTAAAGELAEGDAQRTILALLTRRTDLR